MQTLSTDSTETFSVYLHWILVKRLVGLGHNLACPGENVVRLNDRLDMIITVQRGKKIKKKKENHNNINIVTRK